MRCLGFVFWLMASAALAADPPADPFAFHGVRLPASVETWQERLPYFSCNPSPDPKIADVSCVIEGESELTMYAGQYGTIEARAFSGIVGFVNFVDWDCDAQQAENLVSALDERLGKRMGTQVAGTLQSPWWKRGNTEVRFMRGIDRNGKMRFCSITYQTDAFRAESARRQKAD
jgi:hypothetical protein